MLKPNQTNKNIKRYVVFLRDFHTTLGSPKTFTIYNHVKTYVLWRRFFSETCEFVRMMDGHRNGKVSTEMKNLARTTTQMNYDMASAGPGGFRGSEVSYTPHTGGWIRWEGAWAGKPCVGFLAQKIEDIKRFREVRKRIYNTNHY